MPALVVNFDDVLFRNGGAAPRPDAIRLIKDAAEAGWRIALTSALAQDEVRSLLANFLADLAETALVAGSDYAPAEEPNIVDFAAGKLGTMPEQTLVLERGELGFARANEAGLPNIILSHALPTDGDLFHTQLVIDRFGLSDDVGPITVLADPHGIRPRPLVTVEHLEACLAPFVRRLNEFGVIRSEDA